MEYDYPRFMILFTWLKCNKIKSDWNELDSQQPTKIQFEDEKKANIVRKYLGRS